jgi:hypothetical protein
VNRNNVWVIGILFSFFVTGFFAGNLYAVNELNNIELPDQNITVDRTDVDVMNNHSVNNEYDPERFFYIQPPNTDVDVDWDGRTAEIDADQIINGYGSSMRPTMWTGNTVLAQETNGNNLDEGTIVSNGNITHRIKADYTEIYGYYLTQGDNNDQHERMTPEEIKYKIVGVIFTEK